MTAIAAPQLIAHAPTLRATPTIVRLRCIILIAAKPTSKFICKALTHRQGFFVAYTKLIKQVKLVVALPGFWLTFWLGGYPTVLSGIFIFCRQ